MSNLAQWSDDYKIGIQEIDSQHQFLFSLFHDLQQTQDLSQFQSCFMKIYQYTREHFLAEEKIMKACHYPKYETHQEQHNQLISKLNELSLKMEHGAEFRETLTLFLGDWLVFHILAEDLDIALYI